VVDQRTVDLYAAEWIPAAAVVLAVEIVAARGRTDEWHRKPQLYAASGIAYFWRVECAEDGRPMIYEYWLDHETGEYRPSPAAVHVGTLATAVPFAVRAPLLGWIEGTGRKVEDPGA
jgi:hypothetical protein